MRLWPFLCAVLAWLALAPAAAAAAADQEYVTNPEGVWIVGRGEATSASCSAGMPGKGGGIFMLLAKDGQVSFTANAKSRAPRGKAGVLATDRTRFEFTPSYDQGAVFLDGALDDKVLSALREAQDLVVAVDGKTVFEAHVAGTGIAGAIDGMLSCAKGQSGWWGKGAQMAAAQPAETAELPRNKEGFWIIVPQDGRPFCTAAVPLDGGGSFVLVAGQGVVLFGMTSPDPLRKGRKGRFEIDGLGIDFTPGYEGKDYLFSPEPLSAPALAALRGAKEVRASVDGKPLLRAVLEGSGHEQVMTDAAACARGESGWWGKGAAQPAR